MDFAKSTHIHTKEVAKVLGVSFKLTVKELDVVLKKPCYYCRSEIDRTNRSISRLDSQRGFTSKNIVSTCNTCLTMKGDMSHGTFMEHIDRISNRSDGDDYNTRSTHVTEENVGDTGKILLLNIYDMTEKHNMQKEEIRTFFNCLLDEHIIETDELEEDL